MSFAAPIWLAIAGVVAAGLVVAHLITISQPRREVLPTVRFVPQTAPLAVTRARRPSDVALLVVRLVAVGLLGLALAGAHVTRGAPARVVLIDRSRAAADGGGQPPAATAQGDSVVIAFGDTVGPSTLSGALVTAHRAIAGRAHGEQSELVIVSPLAREQVDSATAPLLALWPGSVRVERTPASTPPSDGSIQVFSTGDDPISPALSRVKGTGRVRLFRVALPGAADTAWARDSGGVLVVWPATFAGLSRRVPGDTQQGLAAGAHVVIGAFTRAHAPRDGRAVVRWLDGAAAATEVAFGNGCIREVAIPVDVAGDIALRESFRGIMEALTSPCGGPRDLAPADLASLLPAGDRVHRAGVAAADPGRLALWLALGALAALVAEQLLRRRRA